MEEQKSLRFNFPTPGLQFITKDGRILSDSCQFPDSWPSTARIRWQAKGNVVAIYKQHMRNSVSKENKTSLYSLWMPSAEAKRKHEALLAELRQGTSWLNMYQTMACFATLRHFYQNWLEKVTSIRTAEGSADPFDWVTEVLEQRAQTTQALRNIQ